MGYGFGVPMNREAVIQALLGADAEIFDIHDPGCRYALAFVGGGSLSVGGYITRTTTDVDALEGPRKFEKEFGKYQINFETTAYMKSFPYGWQDRVVRLDLDTKVIDYYVASLEDVVASKLASDRDGDAADVRSPAVLADLDWDKMDLMPEEMRQSTISEKERQYRTFLYRYGIYRDEFGPRA